MSLAEAAGLLLAAATLPGTVELALVTFGALLPRRTPSGKALPYPLRLAVVIPAHNEEGGIVRTVASLRACGGKKTVVVVADNCSDKTAALARQAGARVIERQDSEKRGKGNALQTAFEELLKEDFEWFLVVDADTVVEEGICREIARLAAVGAKAVQVRYAVLNPGDSWRSRLMHVAFMAFNMLRPLGRDNLGLSAGILGNGFALHRDLLEQEPITFSVVEDLAYHLHLVSKRVRVFFSERSAVWAEMPAAGRGALTQRARWEGGRLGLFKRQLFPLLKEIFRGKLRLIEPLLELATLPLVYHLLLLLLTLPLFFSYAAAALLIAFLYVAAAIWIGGGTFKDLLALGYAPLYAVWKLLVLPALFKQARRNAPWNRTDRNG